MTWILKALAAAVVAGLGITATPNHPVAPVKVHLKVPASVSTFYERSDADIFSGLKGHAGSGVYIPPPPPAPEPPVEAPADVETSQPLASLPIAAAPAPAPPPAPAPAPAVVVGSTQQALINSDRSGAGLGALTWNSCLAGIAYQNASRMAGQGYISHANGVYADLGCGIGNHSGENVGYWSGGINDPELNRMFMNSPEHRANIMGGFRYVGTAWVVAKDGKAYLAVEFD